MLAVEASNIMPRLFRAFWLASRREGDPEAAREDQAEAAPLWQAEGPSPYFVWVIWFAWVPLFVPAIAELWSVHPAPLRLALSLIGVTLFFGIYLLSSWLDARYLASTPFAADVAWRTSLRVWLVLAALSLLGTGLALLNGGNIWLNLFYYISGYSGGRLTWRPTALAVAGLVILVTLTALLAHNSWNTIASTVLFVVVIGALISAFGYFVRTGQRLRMARAEIARLAATAERLRIARDLHDLLGHNLSLIALKSELAWRLLEQAPARAGAEIRDIEQVARMTLQEVREAVSSYRRPSLVDELRAARELLEVAGVRYRLEGGHLVEGIKEPALEVACSWIVREGVTNVIKHSRARECGIRFRREARLVWIEIVNDGLSVDGQSAMPGNGLRGLAERVMELGGQLAAGPVDGGFRLAAALPLTPRRRLEAASPGLERSLSRQERPEEAAGGLERALIEGRLVDEDGRETR